MIRNQETLAQTLAAISRFINERLVPIEDQVDREGRIPDQTVNEMRALGLAGLTLPEEFGGAGLTIEEKVSVTLAMGWTSPAFNRRLASNAIPGYVLVESGSAEQKRSWLTKLASGQVTASFALTEPDAGSDAASIRTTARRDGDDYILNGSKRFITNAPYADVFLVLARTNPEDKGARGISAFFISADTPGLTRGPADQKMGLHGNDTGDVMFDDCRVPASCRLGAEGQGFPIAMQRLDLVRLEVAAIAVGHAERLIHEAMSYAKARQQFGKPIAEFQLIQAMLADSRTEAYAARCMVLETARRIDRDETSSTEAACCKLFATEMVGRVADRAVQIHGGAGFMQGAAVERFYRDVRIYRIFDGTNQIQQLLIAKNMLREAD